MCRVTIIWKFESNSILYNYLLWLSMYISLPVDKTRRSHYAHQFSEILAISLGKILKNIVKMQCDKHINVQEASRE